MAIRTYQPGDEQAQAHIYNAVAGSLPGFKPSSAAEIARRYAGAGDDVGMRYFAVDQGQVVGYAVFGAHGRISAPWCLPRGEAYREPLLEAVLTAMRQRGLAQAWAAYRGDWHPVLEFLREHGFTLKRSMVNYVADVSRLPAPTPLPSNRRIDHVKREDIPQLMGRAPGLFADSDGPELERFYWSNSFYSFPESLFVLRESANDQVRGAFLLVKSDRFADPTKIDPAMPCFRLGAFGTERERHKRVTGLFSCVFADPAEGNLLLSAALDSVAETPGLTHIAAQAPSNAGSLCEWYDRFFECQGSFPIVARQLTN